MRSISRLSGSPIAGPGAAKAPAAARASLISWAPALPCLKLINITGYLGWRSAPAPYQPLTSIYQQNKRQTHTHTKKKNRERKKINHPMKQQQLQGGWWYRQGWKGTVLCGQEPPKMKGRDARGAFSAIKSHHRDAIGFQSLPTACHRCCRGGSEGAAAPAPPSPRGSSPERHEEEEG